MKLNILILSYNKVDGERKADSRFWPHPSPPDKPGQVLQKRRSMSERISDSMTSIPLFLYTPDILAENVPPPHSGTVDCSLLTVD
jgi:hypothetical protein